ncbi:urease accessory protein UreD [Mycobacterium sp. LTG2003]
MTAGALHVDLVADPAGRTRVARLVQQFPQRVTAPMYLDPDDPGRAYLCVQNPSAGVFPGDRLRTCVSAARGTRLYLTSQSATQVFAPHAGSADDVARADFDFRVADGAVVEYIPKTVIPQSSSRYRQQTSVSVETGGVFIGWESLAAGRIGHGERFRYHSYDLRTTVSCDGVVLARDRMLLCPTATDVTGAAMLAGYDYFAAMTVVAPGGDVTGLIEALRTVATDEVPCGVSALPGGVGATVRVLGHRAPALAGAEQALRAAARRALARLSEPMVRM